MEKKVLINKKQVKFLNWLFIVFIVCFISGCMLKNNDKHTSETILTKASYELLYYYGNEHTDSLVCGLSAINKVVRTYADDTKETFLRMIIYCGTNGENKDVRGIILDYEEIINLESFVDSCMTDMADNEVWELKLKSGSYLGYEQNDGEIYFGYDPGFCFNLQITPKRLKEILVKAKVDDW
jgi:hypothetical protein